MAISNKELPSSGFIKLNQIIGQKAAGFKRKTREEIPPLIPISRTTFLNRVKSGEYPKPVSLGGRSIAWRLEDIKELIERLGA